MHAAHSLRIVVDWLPTTRQRRHYVKRKAPFFVKSSRGTSQPHFVNDRFDTDMQEMAVKHGVPYTEI